MNEARRQVLALEYQSLRSDLQMRSAARFQFLGFVTASAAILITGLSGQHSSRMTWILLCVAVGLFIFGLISFWIQGREQARISAHIAHIEERMNNLARLDADDPDLLTWETGHQKRSFFNRWILGLRVPS